MVLDALSSGANTSLGGAYLADSFNSAVDIFMSSCEASTLTQGLQHGEVSPNRGAHRAAAHSSIIATQGRSLHADFKSVQARGGAYSTVSRDQSKDSVYVDWEEEHTSLLTRSSIIPSQPVQQEGFDVDDTASTLHESHRRWMNNVSDNEPQISPSKTPASAINGGCCAPMAEMDKRCATGWMGKQSTNVSCMSEVSAKNVLKAQKENSLQRASHPNPRPPSWVTNSEVAIGQKPLQDRKTVTISDNTAVFLRTPSGTEGSPMMSALVSTVTNDRQQDAFQQIDANTAATSVCKGSLQAAVVNGRILERRTENPINVVVQEVERVPLDKVVVVQPFVQVHHGQPIRISLQDQGFVVKPGGIQQYLLDRAELERKEQEWQSLVMEQEQQWLHEELEQRKQVQFKEEQRLMKFKEEQRLLRLQEEQRLLLVKEEERLERFREEERLTQLKEEQTFKEEQMLLWEQRLKWEQDRVAQEVKLQLDQRMSEIRMQEQEKDHRRYAIVDPVPVPIQNEPPKTHSSHQQSHKVARKQSRPCKPEKPSTCAPLTPSEPRHCESSVDTRREQPLRSHSMGPAQAVRLNHVAKSVTRPPSTRSASVDAQRSDASAIHTVPRLQGISPTHGNINHTKPRALPQLRPANSPSPTPSEGLPVMPSFANTWQPICLETTSPQNRIDNAAHQSGVACGFGPAQRLPSRQTPSPSHFPVPTRSASEASQPSSASPMSSADPSPGPPSTAPSPTTIHDPSNSKDGAAKQCSAQQVEAKRGQSRAVSQQHTFGISEVPSDHSQVPFETAEASCTTPEADIPLPLVHRKLSLPVSTQCSPAGHFEIRQVDRVESTTQYSPVAKKDAQALTLCSFGDTDHVKQRLAHWQIQRSLAMKDGNIPQADGQLTKFVDLNVTNRKQEAGAGRETPCSCTSTVGTQCTLNNVDVVRRYVPLKKPSAEGMTQSSPHKRGEIATQCSPKRAVSTETNTQASITVAVDAETMAPFVPKSLNHAETMTKGATSVTRSASCSLPIPCCQISSCGPGAVPAASTIAGGQVSRAGPAGPQPSLTPPPIMALEVWQGTTNTEAAVQDEEQMLKLHRHRQGQRSSSAPPRQCISPRTGSMASFANGALGHSASQSSHAQSLMHRTPSPASRRCGMSPRPNSPGTTMQQTTAIHYQRQHCTQQNTTTSIRSSVHSRRSHSETTFRVRIPRSMAPVSAEDEEWMRSHELRITPGTEAGVEFVVWCGSAAFPILRQEAWQKIFAHECARATWSTDFPSAPSRAPHEPALTYCQRVLPQAQELLPRLAQRDRARGVPEVRWLSSAGDWLQAIWGELPLWGPNSDTLIRELLGTPWALQDIQRRVYTYWLGVVAPAFQRCAGCHQDNGQPRPFEGVWVLKALLAKHCQGPNPITDKLVNPQGLHHYLLWEHQKLVWAQQSLREGGPAPTAQGLGPLLHSFFQSFKPEEPLPCSAGKSTSRYLTPREYWESIPRVSEASHPELYRDRTGLWWFF